MGVIYYLGKVIIFSLIILFLAYEVASRIEWEPNGFAVTQYKNFKTFLANDAKSSDFTASTAQNILDTLDDLEKGNEENKAYELEQDKIAKECGENTIMRSVQLIGASEEKKKECVDGKKDPVTKAQDTVNNFNKAQQDQIDTLNKL